MSRGSAFPFGWTFQPIDNGVIHIGLKEVFAVRYVLGRLKVSFRITLFTFSFDNSQYQGFFDVHVFSAKVLISLF